MKEETCERILNVADEIGRAFGFSTMSAGINAFKTFVEEQEEFLNKARTREGFRELIINEPEPNPFDLTVTLGVLRTFPFLLRRLLPKMAKDLPINPGGHPRALTPQGEAEVCVEIGTLLGQGVSLMNAQTRLAQRMDVSVRTIQRAWQKRKELSAGSNPV
ncbi:MAG: hypothetical protein HY651_13145 [Acidobacteria bacterium]|nr:hypothetical protein [Acidobacteriota bacterium]